MYIKANIDDCAIIINDFLPKELFKKISNYKYNTTSNSHKEWEKNLFLDKDKSITMKSVKIAKLIATIDKGEIKCEDNILKEFINILINCPFIPYKKNSKIIISYYEYDKFSGINWHNDGTYTLNYSFYIHSTWDDNWGGETLLNTGRGLPLACIPYSNTLLAIKNNVAHKVCPVTGPIKRKVLQIRGIFYE